MSLKTGAHHCHACGSKAKVTAMSHWEGDTRRQLECDCGERWLSVEAITKRLQRAATGLNPLQPAATGCNGLQPAEPVGSTALVSPRKPPPAVAQPSAIERRGVGGVLPSDQLPVRLSDPDPSLVVNPNRARERQRRVTREFYPPEFETEWGLTSRTGSKDRACETWERLGKPRFGEAWAVWQKCHEWQQEWHNEPHVVTWLNDGRYRQFPPTAPVKRHAAPQARSAGNVDVLKNWLEKEAS